MDVLATAGFAGAGFGTVRKAPFATVASGAPSRLLAVVATVITTRVSYGRALAGWKTRTVSSSANETLPATSVRPATTAKAFFVEASSIGWVNRTEIPAPRSTSFVSARGRNRTTPGETPVRTASVAVGTAMPSASRTPSSVRRYVVLGRSGASGAKVHDDVGVVAAPVTAAVVAVVAVGASVPGVAGTIEKAASTVAGSMARSKAIVNALPTPIRLPAGTVAAIVAAAASRVRKAARAGVAMGAPLAARAPASTVTVWYVPAAQWPFGVTVSVVAVGSQESDTAVVGVTVSADPTDASSIGTLNWIVTGSARSRSVATTVLNAAAGRGTSTIGAVAAAGAGRPMTMTPSATTTPRPTVNPIRTSGERRRAVLA